MIVYEEEIFFQKWQGEPGPDMGKIKYDGRRIGTVLQSKAIGWCIISLIHKTFLPSFNGLCTPDTVPSNSSLILNMKIFIL